MELLDLLVRDKNSLEPSIPRHLHHGDAHGLFQLGIHRSPQPLDEFGVLYILDPRQRYITDNSLMLAGSL